MTEEKIAALAEESRRDIEASETLETLQNVYTKYLGKKSSVSTLLKGLGTLPPEERRRAGQKVNDLKQEIETLFKTRKARLSELEQQRDLEGEAIDVTLPGRLIPAGHLHPVSRMLHECVDVFLKLGFQIAVGPEIETDYYNFESLNQPKDHPARDMQDTFYITEDVLLRTHTSPVQTRTMERYKPPLRIISPGKVYRRDDDITHSPMFFQIEGFAVDENVTFADLRGTLEAFLHKVFSPETAVRFRPSYFPFTEPSAEVDISCIICGGKGCRVCKETGWLEILGCGMIHPVVFEYVNYDAEKYTGFAFGMGIERITMLKYGIDNMRLFYQNDMRFLRQF